MTDVVISLMSTLILISLAIITNGLDKIAKLLQEIKDKLK